jgi:MoaA/NifB/PqqE/SkfB family radical SAM enzyme
MRVEKIDVKCGFVCNNRCRFCVQGDKRSQYGGFPEARVREALDDGRSVTDQVVLTGGEVTIRPDFLSLVRHAHALGYRRIQIQTNGRMFASRAFCADTVAAGANEFSLALHGHVAALHEYLTRAPGSFRETVTGIRNLLALGQYVGTNTVIVRPNFRHLPEIARLLTALGVRQYQFAFVHALGTAAEQFERMVPRYELVEPYVKRALAVGIRQRLPVMTEAIPYCFMRGYTRWIAERIIPRTKIYDVKVLDDYTHYRLTEGKCKGPPCADCACTSVCEGPWKEYPQAFGWGEFKAVAAQADRGVVS